MKRKGKHPHHELAATKVKNLKEPGRYVDGNGLYLIVDPSGAKRWVLRTVVHGKRRDMGLGGVTTVSLAEAREKAAALRKLARSGGDPLAERRKDHTPIPTFEQAAREVYASHSASWKNRKHAAQWIKTLEEYVFPVFGDRRVDYIDTPEVLKALSPIWLTKPETARRVRQRIGVVMDWAKAQKFRSGDNPIRGVTKGLPKQTDRPEHHVSLPYAEVSGFIRDMRASDSNEITRLAFEFLILTATRTNEVIGARWSEINLKEKVWTLPKERMKAKVEHRVPLSPRCLEILKRARELAGEDSDYVFPGRTPGEPLSNMAFLMTLRRMGCTFTAHGFRSTFRDWAAERTNFPNDVCEAALAHSVKDKTEAAYKRSDLFERRRDLMTTWAAFATEGKAKVLPLRSRGNR